MIHAGTEIHVTGSGWFVVTMTPGDITMTVASGRTISVLEEYGYLEPTVARERNYQTVTVSLEPLPARAEPEQSVTEPTPSPAPPLSLIEDATSEERHLRPPVRAPPKVH